jgi:hypothetical protein
MRGGCFRTGSRNRRLFARPPFGRTPQRSWGTLRPTPLAGLSPLPGGPPCCRIIRTRSMFRVLIRAPPSPEPPPRLRRVRGLRLPPRRGFHKAERREYRAAPEGRRTAAQGIEAEIPQTLPEGTSRNWSGKPGPAREPLVRSAGCAPLCPYPGIRNPG